MQTFLPYPSFVRSARALDDKRLANQVNEALTCHEARPGAEAWRWHPAARMWRGYEDALLLYRTACMDECTRRGIKWGWRIIDLFKPESTHVIGPDEVERMQAEIEIPAWLGWEPFHAAHRASLVHKNRMHYEPLFGTPEWRGYLWPVADHSYLPVARRARGPKAAAKACKLFNAHHVVGARVEVWPGLVEGAGLVGETTTDARVQGLAGVFVRVPGRAQAFYTLTHVRVLDVDLGKISYKLPG